MNNAEKQIQMQFQQFRTFIQGTAQGYVERIRQEFLQTLANFRQAALVKFTTLQTNQQSIVDSLSILHSKVDAMNTKVDNFTAQYDTDRTYIQAELTALASQLSDVEEDVTLHRSVMETP